MVTDNLSKTLYCSGVQCPKMLWLKKRRPELFDDSVINQAQLPCFKCHFQFLRFVYCLCFKYIKAVAFLQQDAESKVFKIRNISSALCCTKQLVKKHLLNEQKRP